MRRSYRQPPSGSAPPRKPRLARVREAIQRAKDVDCDSSVVAEAEAWLLRVEETKRRCQEAVAAALLRHKDCDRRSEAAVNPAHAEVRRLRSAVAAEWAKP